MALWQVMDFAALKKATKSNENQRTGGEVGATQGSVCVCVFTSLVNRGTREIMAIIT